MLKGMRFLLVVLFAVGSAACGSKGTTETRTVYENYTSATTKGGKMGGAVQGTALPLATKAMASIAVSTIAGVAGSAGTADGDGVAVKPKFNIVNGVTTDGTNLYITDFGSHTIRKYSFSNHSTTTIAGIPGGAGSNTPLLGLDGAEVPVPGVPVAGRTDRAVFNNPSGITTDGTNLYVADYNNSTIRKLVLSNGVWGVTTMAGLAGIHGSLDATTGVGARFNHPIDITTDGINLYVTDSSNLTIRKIGLAYPYPVTTIAGSPGAGGSNPPVGAAPIPGSSARFQYPARITTDGTNLYVTDFVKNTISMIDGTTHLVSTIAGTAGMTGATDGSGAAASFSNINGITSDGTNLYVTDSNNHTVRKVVPSGGVWTVTTIAGSPGNIGSVDASVADGGGGNARFKFPIGITTDGTSLYVMDSNNYTIRKIQ